MRSAAVRSRRGSRWGLVALAVLSVPACDRAADGDTTSSTARSSVTSSVAPSPATDLQLRPVERIVSPASSDWAATQPTCPGDGADLADCVASAPPAAGIVLRGPKTEGAKYVLGPVIVDGSDVARATARPEGQPGLGWSVSVDLTAGGTAALLAATEAVAGAADPRNRIAIIVDGTIVSAPAVMAPISSGAVVLTSGLTEADAETLTEGLTGSG